MRNDASPLEIIKLFLATLYEKERTKESNILRMSLSKWIQYYEFLKIINERYDSASIEYSQLQKELLELFQKKGSGIMTSAEMEMMEKSKIFMTKVHLEVESFYIFSKILMDRTADTFGYYFGIHLKKFGSTYSQMQKYLEESNYLELKDDDQDFKELRKEIQNDIVDFRNEEIEHISDPRSINATSWDSKGSTRISKVIIYPEPGQSAQKNTKTPKELFLSIDQYLIGVIDFFKINKNKSILL